MNINVTNIVNDKINELSASGVVGKAIIDTFEKTIINAVVDSLDSYRLRQTIENKMTEEVSKVVTDLDLRSYNGFMVDKMMHIINDICREDICQKAERKFKELFLCQIKKISLLSIFEKFRDIVCDEVEESDKWDRIDEGWHCKCEVDETYGWIACELDYEDHIHKYRGDNKISFTVHRDH